MSLFQKVLLVTGCVFTLVSWVIVYHTNNMLIKQNEKLYKQVTACHEFLDNRE